MRTIRSVTTVITVPVVAMTLALASVLTVGCSGRDDADAGNGSDAGGGERGPDAGLDAAAARTLDAESMAFELELSVDAFGGTQQSAITGRADFATATGEVTVTSPGEEVHAIVDTDGFWVTSDVAEFVDELPDGATWVRGSFAEMGSSEVIVPLAPPALLYLLEGATGTRAGDGGASYTFDIDVARAISQAPADRRDEVGELIWSSADEPLDATGEVVVDEGERIRSFVAEATVPGEATPVHLRWSASFDEFDRDVTVDPPDADDVVDLADVPGLRSSFFGL